MALVFKDRVKQVTDTTGGTGALTFASTPDGFQSFTAAGLDTTFDTFYYLAESQTIAGEWEVGVGTSDGSVLIRTAVLSSSNSGSLVDFTAGEAVEVSVVLPAGGVTGENNTSGTQTNVLPAISSITRSSDESTIVFSSSHGLSTGSLTGFAVTGCTPFSFNATGRVTAFVVDSTTITYYNPGPDESASVVGTAFVVGVTGYAFGGDNTASGRSSSAVGAANTASGTCASAFGYHNTASGSYSSAFGYYNTTTGAEGASAFGNYNTVSASGSTAVGAANTANDDLSSAFGSYNTASGTYASAFGYHNTASGSYSSAFGYRNDASSLWSSAIGNNNTASNTNSTAVGRSNTASGLSSTAVGYGVTTTTNSSQEFGFWPNSTTRASAIRIHGTGYVAISAPKTNTALTDGGATAGSEADGTLMRGAYAIRINTSGEPILDYNDAGTVSSTSLVTNTSGTGTDSTLIGVTSTASGFRSSALGYGNSAGGDYSSAFGYRNIANGDYSSAIGYRNTADGLNASAIGYRNIASAGSSAIGYRNTVSGVNSLAVGHMVTNTTNSTQEFGHWANSTTRTSAIRIHSAGYAAISMQNSSSALTDGGATHGSEANGTLMREAYSIRRDGDDLYIDVNIGGTVKTLSLGTAI